MRKLLLLLLVASSAWATAPVDHPLLQPTMEERFTSNLAVKLLTNWHYKEPRLDDDLSSKILDSYLEMLDPNRSYLLAADVASFERFRRSLDDALRHSDLTPAFEIFNRYAERVEERVKYARERVKEPFDFAVDENYVYDRSKAPWAQDSKELDEIWRMRVKNDYLRLKLAGKEPQDIVDLLDERYANLDRRVEELKSDDIFSFFMNAFALAIEPHTAYLSPRSSENFEISMKLSLEGIGALLGRESEYTSIARIVPGGPADKDGRLKAGDRVTAVGQGRDGKMVDVVGWRVDDVVDLIRGPKDTVVRLEVLPEGKSVDEPGTVIDITRGEVKLEEQAASSRVINVPRKGQEPLKIGVIDLPVFYLDFNGRAMNRPDYRSSTRDVRRLIEELKQQNIDGLVVDLRNNGGGSLLEATTLTGLFIDKGPVVQVRSSSGRVQLEEDNDPGMAWDGPLGVLVNRYSASASEIFAAAIQDYGRGIIIGEPTFGKGTVQSLLDLDDYALSDSPKMGQLKITQAQFFRVNGGSTQNRGVTPDIRMPSAGDPQEYGERSLPNALPWSEIDPAQFQRSGDLHKMVAVTDDRFHHRMAMDKEFTWLEDDIKEYNQAEASHSVSLLESKRREEMAEHEAKRKERGEAEGEGPLLGDESLIGADDVSAEDLGEDDSQDNDDDKRPDLLLRESARIVADMVELGADNGKLLASQFAQLQAEHRSTSIN